ncbi:ATP-binding cassette domain-containing protein [Cupriavidus taiwanensis]|uniref:ATP-binding cassette domain-containing protein n=1 Tax=Cupriavidus taiwanensis TaxID=164546 RepID=UPI000E10B2CD|nr:ATP-binding cassette domain-containing protein [Cupriavidus taiwanensis]SOY43194.1 ALIPHATIC SULFONATES transport protein; ABC TRANSPORTER, ATP-BINDING component [Cupriavidus taiwanensis]SOY45676.1 ALIPHATIC SULFONATES transport protein; ABC TRANSPORTER, ATP-BINDING component [Cupriavidus taiwanensis]SOY81121.1 ALIPHATIC SULFONATES transport protein; ABC TRANSPORTER, ATP-BINDING component [Cupriavidus taiwanensis]SOZ53501.1 ALIPHATIC SULFONATES transport protein; ABC TRANSPORTER, ATP-BINDING
MQMYPVEQAALAELEAGLARREAARPVAEAPRTAGGVALHVRQVVKRYDGREVLHNVALDVAPGEFLAIVGRSGCGKSTLLRLVAGLEAVDGGGITVDGDAAASGRARQADVRVMFQDARLLPWKRVLDNVALGLPRARRAEAAQVLAQVGLAERAQAWPARLSGGQRQRVALARALVHRPQLLLLDEPLGALDALTRIEMQALIESLWRRLGFTALLVTHDVAEAVALADRIVLIEDGRIAMDTRVALARPRERGAAGFAQLEAEVLQRVMRPAPPAGSAGAQAAAPAAPAAPAPLHVSWAA